MSRPLLSIAVPTYNRANLLDLCLTRIIEQLPINGEVEVLISNNASTDETQQVVKKHQLAYPQLRYSENEKNGGPDFNIAKAFELATGKYVWVFSDDDLLLPKALEKLLPLLKQEFGVITLAPSFYRHSIHEVIITSDLPLSYTAYDDPNKFAKDVHFWLTYITGVITNKDLVKDADTLYQYTNSFMIQLGWTMPALFKGKPSVRITTPLILGRSLETLDFKLFHVFGASYPVVLEGLAAQKAIPESTKELLIESVIRDYFPYYLKPETKFTHNEQPFTILRKAFWRRRSFWTVLFPLFIRRKVVRALRSVWNPVVYGTKTLIAKSYNRISAVGEAARAAAMNKRFAAFGVGSTLPSYYRIPNPQFISIGRAMHALPGLIIEAQTLRGGKEYSPTICIGDYVRFGANCYLDCCMSLCIGNWVMIGNQVSIADNEPLELDEIVNNFPPFNRGLLCKGGITIEDNVLVEDGVRILTGVSIGRNAIIRAGAVVRDSVPANSIVGGNPAVVLNYINSSTH